MSKTDLAGLCSELLKSCIEELMKMVNARIDDGQIRRDPRR